MKIPSVNPVSSVKPFIYNSKETPLINVSAPQKAEQVKEISFYYNSSYISFGYTSILKDLFKGDKIPSVTHGIYGYPIDKSNVSLEHLQPRSLGGASVLSNFALAHAKANVLRSNKPLPCFLNTEMLDDYLSQFNFEIKGVFNGYKYQDMIRETCEKLGVGEKLLKLPESYDSKLILSEIKRPVVDYGSLKDVIFHIGELNLGMLSKKMLRSLRSRGYLLK